MTCGVIAGQETLMSGYCWYMLENSSSDVPM